MIGLCIAERYYRLGIFRVEYFPTQEHLDRFRSKLEGGLTTWLLGEPMPARPEYGTLY
jgi:hypothetical protein